MNPSLQQAQEEFKKWCEETNAHWHAEYDETGYGEDVYTNFSGLEEYDELLEKVNSLLSQTIKEEREKGKRAWIIGNVISYEKPEFSSAFFEVEEVIVHPINKN